jgi:hypothetical protein
LKNDTDVPVRLFYAFGRQGVPLGLTCMQTLNASSLREALDRAIAENIVGVTDERTESAMLDRLHAAILKEAFRKDPTPGTFSIGALLDASLVDRELQREFLSRYIKHEGTLEDFWKSLEEDQRFKGQVVEDLRLTLVLGRLTGYLIPALQEFKRLRQRRKLAKLGDLAKLTRSSWQEMLRDAAGDGELDLPASVQARITRRG